METAIRDDTDFVACLIHQGFNADSLKKRAIALIQLNAIKKIHHLSQNWRLAVVLEVQ